MWTNHFPKGDNQYAQQLISIDGTHLEWVDLLDDRDYPTADTLDFEFHAEDSGHYSLELIFVTSRYSQEAMRTLVESLDEIILQLQGENKKLEKIINFTAD